MISPVNSSENQIDILTSTGTTEPSFTNFYPQSTSSTSQSLLSQLQTNSPSYHHYTPSTTTILHRLEPSPPSLPHMASFYSRDFMFGKLIFRNFHLL